MVDLGAAFECDPVTGRLRTVSNAQGFLWTGAAFSAQGGGETLFVFDVTGTDDLLTLNVRTQARTALRTGILPGFDAGRGDLAALVAPPRCRSDFSRDGVADPDDLADFIGAYFGRSDPRADFNGDRVVDPDDLADFVGLYFNRGC